MIKGEKYFKYKLYAYFRKYSSPEESFTDHANFFLKNKRYSAAIAVGSDPIKFTHELVRAKYATGVNYLKLMLQVIQIIQRYF